MDRRSDRELWEQEGDDAEAAYMEARRRVQELLGPVVDPDTGETVDGPAITKKWVAEFEKRLAVEDAASKRWRRWLSERPR